MHKRDNKLWTKITLSDDNALLELPEKEIRHLGQESTTKNSLS